MITFCSLSKLSRGRAGVLNGPTLADRDSHHARQPDIKHIHACVVARKLLQPALLVLSGPLCRSRDITIHFHYGSVCRRARLVHWADILANIVALHSILCPRLFPRTYIMRLSGTFSTLLWRSLIPLYVERKLNRS